MISIIDPFIVEFWKNILLTLFCGGMVGLERQLRGKPAGIRTSILICLGTQTFVLLSVNMAGNIDPTRVLGQVVTGIGFIGAGVIMSKEGLVKGVTSAAIIWVLAGIGAAIGLGQSAIALSLTLVTVSVLVGVELLENTFRKLRQGVHSGYHHRDGYNQRQTESQDD
ncbi:MAG: MgtC/SapB family protein [Proteobacteria bacterium]|nr:MgtC/SapB family protein [Pseudomonadota bacterium]MBU1686800.1 MgtC/SapB family protein [Pseudomonadota bacterium]